MDEQTRREIAEIVAETLKQQKSSFTPNNQNTSTSSGGSTTDLKNVKDSAKSFSEVVSGGGTSVSNFADAIAGAVDPTKLFSGSLSSAIGSIESTNNAFMSLSKVGAGLNGDLGELRLGAAASRIGFDEYANIIGRNASQMTMFEGGVKGGMQAFKVLSQDMFAEDGVINGFLNLGYTLSESNEFLLDNMKLMARQARIEGLDARQQTEAALRLAESMDTMAKITGESVEEQRDRLVDAQRDGATQSKLRLLEKQGIEGVQEGFNTAYTNLAAGGPLLQKLFQDYTQAGVPLSEATKNYAAMNQEAAALAKQAADVNASNLPAEEKRRRVAILAERAAAAGLKSADSVTNLSVGSLGQINSIAQTQANVLESTGPLIDQVAAYAQRQGEVLGETITFQEAYRDYMRNISAEQQAQVGGAGPNQGASVAINEATIAIADATSRINTNIAEQIQSNTQLQKIYDSLENIVEGIADPIAQVANDAIDSLPGKSRQEGIRDGLATGVLTPEDVAMIAEAQQYDRMEGPVANAMRTALEEKLGHVLDPDLMKVGIVRVDKGLITNASTEGAVEGPVLSEKDVDGIVSRIFNKLFGGGKASGGPIDSGKLYTVGEEGPELIASGATGQVINNEVLTKLIGVLSDQENQKNSRTSTRLETLLKDFTDASVNMMNPQISGIPPQTIEERTQLALQSVQNMVPNVKTQVSRDTQTLALERFTQDITNATNEMKQTPQNTQTQTNQNSKVEQLLDNLNQSVLQLIRINTQQTQIGKNQIRAVKGAGNLMQGVSVR